MTQFPPPRNNIRKRYGMFPPPSTIVMCMMVVIVVLTSTGEAKFVRTPGATLRLCYFYFGGIDDLGFTFTFNIGRLQTQEQLRNKYPDIQVESLYVPNVFFGVENKTALAIEYITERGCHALITNNEGCLDWNPGIDKLSTMYRNVSIVVLSDNRFMSKEHPNTIFLTYDFAQAYQVTGVEAAMEATRDLTAPYDDTCIGFIAAHEDKRNPNDAVNGFIKGVRSVSATVPIHVFNMRSWWWPPAEERAAENLLSRNCTVIAHYSDPRNIDVLVSKRGFTDSGRRLFSIGPHSNLQQYVGDSVLSAVYNNWANILVGLTSEVVELGMITHNGVPHVHGLSDGSLIVSPASAYAGLDTVQRVATAKEAMKGQSNPFCGVITLRNGTSFVADGADGCVSHEQRRDIMKIFIADAHTTFHPPFVFEDQCPPGTSFAYSTTGMLQLVCTRCPVNTFSTEKGSAQCTPCPEGNEANETGSVNCTVKYVFRGIAGTGNADDGISAGLIIGICIVAVLAVAAVSIAAFLRMKSAAKNKNAPQGLPLCLLFTDVEASTNLWQTYPDAMSVAMTTHHATIRKVIEENGAYEVKTVGDSFMIATRDIISGVLVASEIQSALHAASWPPEFAYNDSDAPDELASSNIEENGGPKLVKDNTTPGGSTPAGINGLKVRIGVHHCTDVTVKHETLHNYYDYYGNDVNVASRVEASARGGQILLNTDSVEALRTHPDYHATLDGELSIKLFARDVTLKGLSTTHGLFTVLPISLSGRTFQPLPGHENDLLEGAHPIDKSDPGSESASIISAHSPAVASIQTLFDVLSEERQLAILSEFFAGHKLKRHGANTTRLTRQLARHVEVLNGGTPGEHTLNRDRSNLSLLQTHNHAHNNHNTNHNHNNNSHLAHLRGSITEHTSPTHHLQMSRHSVSSGTTMENSISFKHQLEIQGANVSQTGGTWNVSSTSHNMEASSTTVETTTNPQDLDGSGVSPRANVEALHSDEQQSAAAVDAHHPNTVHEE